MNDMNFNKDPLASVVAILCCGVAGVPDDSKKPEDKAPKYVRPHAEHIVEFINGNCWEYRTKGSNAGWHASTAPSFNPDYEYRKVPLYSDAKKAKIMDWLTGTEYTFDGVPVSAIKMVYHVDRCVKAVPKLRYRTALLKDGEGSYTKNCHNQNSHDCVEKASHFIKWLGPWQEVEVS